MPKISAKEVERRINYAAEFVSTYAGDPGQKVKALAKELGVSVVTSRKYLKLAEAEESMQEPTSEVRDW